VWKDTQSKNLRQWSGHAFEHDETEIEVIALVGVETGQGQQKEK